MLFRSLWDVVIAGGGLVGMSLGLALAQGGLSVAICDPIAPPEMTDERFDGRVSALAFSCIRMFRVLGLWPGLEAHAQPINDILVSDGAPARKTSPLTLHFDHREIGEVLGYIVENRHTRIALFEAIARQQGIALFSGVAGQAAEKGNQPQHAIELLRKHYDALPQPSGDLALASAYDAARDYVSAAMYLQRIHSGYPMSAEAVQAATRLIQLRFKLGAGFPTEMPAARMGRAVKLLDGGKIVSAWRIELML